MKSNFNLELSKKQAIEVAETYLLKKDLSLEERRQAEKLKATLSDPDIDNPSTMAVFLAIMGDPSIFEIFTNHPILSSLIADKWFSKEAPSQRIKRAQSE